MWIEDCGPFAFEDEEEEDEQSDGASLIAPPF